MLELDPTSHVALAALDALFTRQKMWGDLAENLEAQLALATDDEAQIALMLRLAALRETRDERRSSRRSRATARCSSATPSNAEALGALERLGQRAGARARIAEILEPLYRQIGDYQKLIGVHEVQVRRSDDADAPRRAPPPDRAALRGRGRRSRTAAFDTLARALAEDPANESDAARARPRSRARPVASRISRASSSTLGGEAGGRRSSRSALFTMSARVYEDDIGDVETRDRASTARCSRSTRVNLAAAESLERLFRRPSATRISR